MTTKTRYFVVVSLLVLGIGFSTGLVAYYVGFPAGAFASRGGPVELAYVPRDAGVVAFANVHDIMTSELRQKLHHALPRFAQRLNAPFDVVRFDRDPSATKVDQDVVERDDDQLFRRCGEDFPLAVDICLRVAHVLRYRPSYSTTEGL